MENLKNSLKECQALLSASCQDMYHRLFAEEHLTTLAKTLISCHRDGVPSTPPPPHFSEECTPPLAPSYTCFSGAMQAWSDGGEDVAQRLAETLQSCSPRDVLLLLGQRLTPGSIDDARAIPPLRSRLLEVALQPEKQNLSVAARAWSKHAPRSTEEFWGQVRGSADDKNQQAAAIIKEIIENRTWWNIFHHYKHELVYEARLPSGHGARWGKMGEEFIGFLEPFLEHN